MWCACEFSDCGSSKMGHVNWTDAPGSVSLSRWCQWSSFGFGHAEQAVSKLLIPSVLLWSSWYTFTDRNTEQKKWRLTKSSKQVCYDKLEEGAQSTYFFMLMLFLLLPSNMQNSSTSESQTRLDNIWIDFLGFFFIFYTSTWSSAPTWREQWLSTFLKCSFDLNDVDQHPGICKGQRSAEKEQHQS